MREFYGILKEANPHFFALFSVEFHPITGAPRGDVLRLVWMVEMLFLTSPSDNDTSSTYFQVQDAQVADHYQKLYRAKFCSLGNAGIYWEPVRDRAS